MRRVIPDHRTTDRITYDFSDERDPSLPDLHTLGWSEFSKAHPNGLSQHQHPGHFELCLIVRGLVHWHVGNREYQLKPGSLFLTHPDEIHGGKSNRMDPCEIYWMVFRLDPKKGSFGLSPEDCQLLLKQFASLSRRTTSAPSNFAQDFQRLINSLELDPPHHSMEVRSLVVLIVQALLRSLLKPSDSPAPSKRIQENIDWMSRSVHQQIEVNELAAQVGLKTSYYRELFRKETGFSPLEYFTLLKIKKAQQLLEESEISVTKIAFELGFNSSQYFATTFRRLIGKSPSDYRAETLSLS